LHGAAEGEDSGTGVCSKEEEDEVREGTEVMSFFVLLLVEGASGDTQVYFRPSNRDRASCSSPDIRASLASAVIISLWV